MDAAGLLCILLQHLQKDPQAVQPSLAGYMLWQLLTNIDVWIFNNYTDITDITEFSKHSDSMQTFLFGEPKAKELNFVGEQADTSFKIRKTRIKKKSVGGNTVKPFYNGHLRTEPSGRSKEVAVKGRFSIRGFE